MYSCGMANNPSTPEGAKLVGPTPLEAAAIGLHEAYTAYRAAGFTDDEALTIIARMASNRG